MAFSICSSIVDTPKFTVSIKQARSLAVGLGERLSLSDSLDIILVTPVMQDKTHYAGPGLASTRRNSADPMEMAARTNPMSVSDLFSVVAL
jgi:hypothetical protein